MPFVKQLANVACVWASFGLLAVAELSDSAGPGLLSVSAGSGSTTSAGMGSGHTLVFISSLCCDIPVSKCRGATAYPVLPRSGQTGSDPVCVPLGDSVAVGFSHLVR